MSLIGWRRGYPFRICNLSVAPPSCATRFRLGGTLLIPRASIGRKISIPFRTLTNTKTRPRLPVKPRRRKVRRRNNRSGSYQCPCTGNMISTIRKLVFGCRLSKRCATTARFIPMHRGCCIWNPTPTMRAPLCKNTGPKRFGSIRRRSPWKPTKWTASLVYLMRGCRIPVMARPTYPRTT